MLRRRDELLRLLIGELNRLMVMMMRMRIEMMVPLLLLGRVETFRHAIDYGRYALVVKVQAAAATSTARYMPFQVVIHL